jgi:hypothetical protein
MPSLTGGFTNNVRPTMRRIRIAFTDASDKVMTKRENVKLKMGF